MNASELFEMLLTDADCRNELKTNAVAFAQKHALDEEALQFINNLNLKALDAQATALINKRFFECLSFIPNTVKANGNLKKEFSTFANNYWQDGHKRHRLDAVQFLYHLNEKQMPVDFFEIHWNQFQLQRKWISIKLYRAMNGKRRILLMRRKGSFCKYYWRNL